MSASEFESCGFCAIEAMACGTPALVPNAQGFKDTVQHGPSGVESGVESGSVRLESGSVLQFV